MLSFLFQLLTVQKIKESTMSKECCFDLDFDSAESFDNRSTLDSDFVISEVKFVFLPKIH